VVSGRMISQPAPQRTSSLVDGVTAALAAGIREARSAPGERLPPAAALARRFGVSRTVVREALARLHADGLVETRQGSGAFVAGLAGRPLRFDAATIASPERVLDILELRMGVETEAAALAATRATPEQKVAIGAAVQALADAAGTGADGVEEDLRFHQAIAEATGNPLFPLFVTFLGEHYRASIHAMRLDGAARAALLRRVAREHGVVAEAIRNGDAEEARWAIRRHLRDGRQRILATINETAA
jgi:GntR family transcriptional repressor for pyruvate dehydrogenase complex